MGRTWVRALPAASWVQWAQGPAGLRPWVAGGPVRAWMIRTTALTSNINEICITYQSSEIVQNQLE